MTLSFIGHFPRIRIRRAVVEALTPRRGEKVLDVGCGTGTLLNMIAAAESDLHLVGIDVAPDMLERARRESGSDSGVTFREMSACRLELANGSFDKVVSTLTFHHLRDEEKAVAISEIRRVLRPGGVFVLADFAAPSNTLMRLLFYTIQIADGFANTRSHIRGLLPSLLASAGFIAVKQAGIQNTIYGTVRIYTGTHI